MLEPAVDRNSDVWYNKNVRDKIVEIMNAEEYFDLWRIHNGENKKFTWMQKRNQGSWSRIDYFLCSTNIGNVCTEVDILPCGLTDHSLITMVVEVSESKHGPESWKFNNEFLKDEVFIDGLLNLIRGIKRVYDYLDIFELWELIKEEVVKFVRNYAKKKASAEKVYIDNLYKLLSNLPSSWVQDNTDPNTLKTINTVESELNSFAVRDAQRSAFRCRLQWTEESECNTKYFFNLEKHNYTVKTMYVAKREDRTLTKDYSEILEIQYCFFKDLYTRDNRVHFTMQNNSGSRIDAEQNVWLEQEISQEEMFDAVMTLKSNKCPGCDGLTIEVFRKFHKELLPMLHKVYQKVVRICKLNPSARRSVINLIPKKNKNKLYVRIWHPITLLNYNYKIIAKAIANRLALVIPGIVGPHQTGFIAGRNIQFNILKTAEIVAYLKTQSKEGVIAIVDFEKCFDRVQYPSIEGTLNYFGFGNNFITNVLFLFQDMEICTSNNGYLSRRFKKGRGVNQGCPAIPLIYTLCSEVMAHAIFQNPDIRGIVMYDSIETVLSQFADDTATFLEYSPLVIESFLNTLANFGAEMGLKVSYEKTTLYRVGSLANTNAMIYTTKALKWSNEPI